MGEGFSENYTARSALSIFLWNEAGFTIWINTSIERFMNGVFEIRPSRPRYEFIWDANVVSTYLINFEPLKDIPLSFLTHELLMIFDLGTAQGAQTINAMNIRNKY